MTPKLDEVLADVSAFADDADDVVVEDTGRVLLVRNGRDIECRVFQHSDSGSVMVAMGDGSQITYARFLTHELARMDVFASKMLELRSDVPFYVDGLAEVARPGEPIREGQALELLRQECEEVPAFATRVSFLTADAGHGKTALLRRYQHHVASKFQTGKSQYLFWHVDLQGRQLLRLSEALMGDLADLRYSGLWMPGIVRLMRHGKLILAVDGFDELSAEQGDTDALGALTSLVDQLGGAGVVIAAARRTFFDAEDYASKTALLRRGLASPCYFDQIALSQWGKDQALDFLTLVDVGGQSFSDPAGTYDDIETALGGDSAHPLLSRPFLLSQMAKALLDSSLTPEDFVTTEADPMSGVAAVVRAFIKREVTEKWIFPDSGEPYLTDTQHMDFLALVAEEMYRSQKDRLRLDTVETIAVILMDQWSVAAARRPQIMDMIRAHVLLVLPPDGQSNYRSFDHPEFRDFFVAQALRVHLQRAMADGDAQQLTRFLTYAALSDGTAGYVSALVERRPKPVSQAVSALCDKVRQEWRPTHLHTNVGTLIASLISGVDFKDSLVIDAPLVISSVVLENSALTRVTFHHCSFVNVSLRGAIWSRVTMSDCVITELRIEPRTSSFEEVSLIDTRIFCVKVVEDGEEAEREYSPSRIAALLERHGISVSGRQPALMLEEPRVELDIERQARRFLSLFSRSTTVTDRMIQTKFSAGASSNMVLSKVVPVMERHGLLEPKTWRGGGAGQAWSLRRGVEAILEAIDDDRADAHPFWEELRSLD